MNQPKLHWEVGLYDFATALTAAFETLFDSDEDSDEDSGGGEERLGAGSRYGRDVKKEAAAVVLQLFWRKMMQRRRAAVSSVNSKRKMLCYDD